MEGGQEIVWLLKHQRIRRPSIKQILLTIVSHVSEVPLEMSDEVIQ